ncbi:MAG: GrpB family protein [Methanomassiliicoccales archaeon]
MMVVKDTPGDGLDIVELRDHDPRWNDLFQQERIMLIETLGSLAISIEHVGSTAVPGIRAKPVIDILVTVEDVRLEGVEGILMKLDYSHVPIGDPERLFFRKGMPRTHHVHVVRHLGKEHVKHMLFRDRLIAHPEEAAEYERLKEDLAHRFKCDRQAYSDGKDAFIAMILERAEEEQRRMI